MHMFDQRLQLLVSKEQRRRLEAAAREQRKSVGQLIREAIDARYGSVTREDRVRAAREIVTATGGRYLTPDALNEIVSDERLSNFPHIRPGRRRKR